MTCQGRFRDSKRCATLVSTADGLRASICVGEGADRNSLFSLQFCYESKPSKKKNSTVSAKLKIYFTGSLNKKS